jgi:chaperonin GroES
VFVIRLVNTASRGDIRPSRSLRNEARDMVISNDRATRVAPLADRVVVKALEEAGQMRGGLHIPDTAREKPQQGEIVAVGPGRFDEKGGGRVPMEVKVGDRVLYGRYSGAEVTIEQGQYLILRESDVLAVLP